MNPILTGCKSHWKIQLYALKIKDLEGREGGTLLKCFNNFWEVTVGRFECIQYM